MSEHCVNIKPVDQLFSLLPVLMLGYANWL